MKINIRYIGSAEETTPRDWMAMSDPEVDEICTGYGATKEDALIDLSKNIWETAYIEGFNKGALVSKDQLEKAQLDAFADGVKYGKEESWSAVNGLIKTGVLQGNGCDDTAQRNGIVLASNAIHGLMMNSAPTAEQIAMHPRLLGAA